MIDVEEFERECRAKMAEVSQKIESIIEERLGEVDADYMRAQVELDETTLQFSLALMRCQNRNIPRDDIVAAAGSALGTMIGSMELDFAETITLFDGLKRTYAAIQTGTLGEGDDGFHAEVTAKVIE